jgi:hypothetical protein
MFFYLITYMWNALGRRQTTDISEEPEGKGLLERHVEMEGKSCSSRQRMREVDSI